MGLSIKDLIFNPVATGPDILRPSAQGASEAASLAAFNDLLGQVSQIQRNTGNRPPEREASPESIEPPRSTYTDDEQPWVSTSRQQDPADRPATGDERTSRTEDWEQTSTANLQTKPEGPSANPEDDTPATVTPDTPTNEVVGNIANVTHSQPAAFPVEQLSAVATAAVTSAQATPDGPSGTAPGQAVSNTVASAIAGATKNRTSASALTHAALRNSAVVGPAGSFEKPDVESLALRGPGSGTNPPTATPLVSTATVKGLVPTGVLRDVNLPAEIALAKSPVVAQSPSPLAPGILMAQEVANSQAAVFQFQTGNAETGSIAKPSTGIPSGGAPATPQMAGTQSSGVDTLPSPASASATESTLGQPTSTATTSGSTTSGIPSLGPNATAASGPAGPTASTAAMRAPQPLPVPVDQFPIQIARAAAGGADHIIIRLKPASLGQVEVKLEVTHDGRIAAVVTAERSETLDMLQRDARALERALQDAGLKTDSNSLQFNLRSEGGSDRDSQQGNAVDSTIQHVGNGDENEMPMALLAGGYENLRAAGGGIDISV